MRRPSLAVLALTAFLPLQTFAGTITVRPGETLSDIAARYNTSTTSLMRLNGISDPDHVEVGSRLKVPGPGSDPGPGRHRVSSGETLSSIAAQYKVRSRDLMAVNGLGDANHVELGQTLKLPQNAVIPQKRTKPAPIQVVSGASEHTVGKGQTLSQIARAYQIPVASLISINALEDPNKVKVGTRLYLKAPTTTALASTTAVAAIDTVIQDSASGAVLLPTAVEPAGREPSPATTPAAQPQPKPAKVATAKPKPKPAPVATAKPKPKPKPAAAKPKPAAAKPLVAKKADWRSYGPLQVDWANWQPMDGSHVVPTLNDQGQALYLAVNCSAGKLNVTGADGSWKTWAAPQNGFEKDLMKDRCQARA